MASQMSLGQVGQPQPCQHEVILPLRISCPLNTNWRHPRPLPSPWALGLTKYLRQSLPGSARPCPSGSPPQTGQTVLQQGWVAASANLVGGCTGCTRHTHLTSSLQVFGRIVTETETCWPQGVLGPPPSPGIHSVLQGKMLHIAKPIIFEDTISR